MIFAAASPMTRRLMITACCVRLSARDASRSSPRQSRGPLGRRSACGRDSRSVSASSYRLGLGEHAITDRCRQVARSANVDPHTQKLFHLVLKAAEIEQGRIRQGVDQDIKVASGGIGAPHGGTEDARIRQLVALRGGLNGDPVALEATDGFTCAISSRELSRGGFILRQFTEIGKLLSARRNPGPCGFAGSPRKLVRPSAEVAGPAGLQSVAPGQWPRVSGRCRAAPRRR